jgi:chain length determinant protein EpsF
MTLYQFLRTLAARRWLVVCTVLAMYVLLALVVLIFPTKYTGTASVVVSSQSEDPILGAMVQIPLSETFVSTQVDIISSPRVARRVVNELKLDKDPRLIELWRDDTDGKGDIVAWIGDALLNYLKVKPGRDSNVIEINFTSVDPQFAALLANTFAKSYLTISSELKIEPARQTAQFFDVRIGELRAQLEQAQARLVAGQKEVGMVVTPERLDVENSRLSDLSQQLVLAQGMRADSASRSRGAEGNNAASPDVIQNGVIQQLKTQIATAESNLTQLSGQLGPNHPQYLRAQQQLDDLRASLARETAQVGSSLDTASRVGVDRVGQLQGAVEQQRQRIIELSAKRDKLQVLQHEVDNAEKAYELVMQRYAQTSIESHVASADVSLLTPAAQPTEPSFPRIKLFAALTLVVGIFLGVGLALLAEVFNPRVHSASDVALQIGVPVFAVVPKLKSRRARFMLWFHALGRRKTSIARA